MSQYSLTERTVPVSVPGHGSGSTFGSWENGSDGSGFRFRFGSWATLGRGKNAMVYTIFLRKQGKRVYTIGPERRVYTIEPQTRKKKKRRVSTVVVYTFFFPAVVKG